MGEQQQTLGTNVTRSAFVQDLKPKNGFGGMRVPELESPFIRTTHDMRRFGQHRDLTYRGLERSLLVAAIIYGRI